MPIVAVLIALLIPHFALAATNPPAPGFNTEGSDPKAIHIADQVMERLGGRQAWNHSRYITWRFFGGRRHVWDKWTGDLRFEQDQRVVLMNIHLHDGQVFDSGTEITHPDSVAAHIQAGYRAWVNDSYWLAMPYKLKDSGVTLKYQGQGQTEAGKPAHILQLTFAGIGVTPDNKYEVWVDKEDHLVRQWAFYANYNDPEPRFTLPWENWQPYGKILFADSFGQRRHTEIGVFDHLPRAVFADPAPINLFKAED